MAIKKNSLENLFVDQLKDLYDAEQQIIQALPKMVEAASSRDLKQSLQQHLDMTRKQSQRLEQIFTQVNAKPGGKKCVGMQGLVKEGEEVIKELKNDSDALDAGLIASAQKVEHYEISGYGTARAYARMLGHNEAVNLLTQTLDEEAQTDEKLTRLAESHINAEAMS